MARLRSQARPARPGLRWTTEDQWHVTLRFLGEVAEDQLDGLRSGLAGVGPGAVQARSGPVPRRLGGRMWVLPVEGLGALAAAVESATASVVPTARHERRRFRGHLTLARVRQPSSFDGLAQPELACSWAVPDFGLVKSDLLPTGARHEVLDRWPLPAG